MTKEVWRDPAVGNIIHGQSGPSREPVENAQRFGEVAPSAPTKPTKPMDPTVPTDDTKPGRERTRLYRPGPAHPADDPAARDAMDDPPAGWLVIVDGPGKGHVATLGYGVNAVGRERTQRVSIDHGDALISRVRHVVITYDPEGRNFYVQHGEGTNLSYLNDEPVLTPMALEPFAHIRIGKTTLHFVPLCGERFCWEDQGGTGGA